MRSWLRRTRLAAVALLVTFARVHSASPIEDTIGAACAPSFDPAGVLEPDGALMTSYVFARGQSRWLCRRFVCADGTFVDNGTVTRLSPAALGALEDAAAEDALSATHTRAWSGFGHELATTVYAPSKRVPRTTSTSDVEDVVRRYSCF